MKIRKFLIVTLTLLLIVLGIESTRAQDATKSTINLPALKQNLALSIGIFKCSSGTGLGFIGNYSISAAAQSRGINSYFVTSFQNLLNCRFETWDSITAIYGGEQKVAQMLLNNGDASDFAVVSTPFSGPAIDLYDSTIPEKGWWVLVAQYSPEGFIEWSESTITSIDYSKFIFYIEGRNILRQSGGLVFDNLGNFLGMIPSKVPKTANQQVLVSGAPLQCPAKLSGATTTTNCTLDGKKVFREDIWSKPLVVPMQTKSPTSTLTPTSSPSASTSPTPLVTPTFKPNPRKTLICVKGKLSRKIISLNPKCPLGWKNL